MAIASGTICARAARVQLPILISDVTTDEDWVPFLSFSEVPDLGAFFLFHCFQSRRPDRCHILPFCRSCNLPGAK